MLLIRMPRPCRRKWGSTAAVPFMVPNRFVSTTRWCAANPPPERPRKAGAGVVDPNVDAAERLDCSCARRSIASASVTSASTAIARTPACSHACATASSGQASRGEREVGAALRESERGRLADAARGAGDDDGDVPEVVHGGASRGGAGNRALPRAISVDERTWRRRGSLEPATLELYVNGDSPYLASTPDRPASLRAARARQR